MKITRMVAAAAFSCWAGLALSADLPSKAAPFIPAAQVVRSWTGVYVGVNAGYAIQRDNSGITAGNALSSTVQNIGIVPTSLDTKMSGGVYGGQVGANWQFGAAVIGVEADGQYAKLSGDDTRRFSTAPLGFPASVTTTGEKHMDWFGTVRGRAGFAWGDDLFYGTGGFAYGKAGGSASAVLATPIKGLNATAEASSDSVRTGWTAGGGWEHRVANTPINLKAEYLYVNLGSDDLALSTKVLGAPISYTVRNEYQFHVFRAGLNYRF